ncbi:MAG: DUF6531 domain-containing protein, partial [Verrucomicrobiota bacterium]|nr:DUF6531 domain-containing protein [Verrucomicrobiota bacterium]
MKTLSSLKNIWFSIVLGLIVVCKINAQIVINEIAANPPGTDNPYEFIEIKGPANAPLTNLYLVVLAGDLAKAGNAEWVFNLAGANGTNTLGNNGLLVVKAQSGGYTPAAGTTIIPVTGFNSANSLDNGSLSFFLIESLTAPVAGTDYDPGNIGWCTVAPMTSCRILDVVGWRDNDDNDLVYGGVRLKIAPGETVEGASRFPTDTTASSTNAWYYGKLQGSPGSTSYTTNTANRSLNFPTFPSIGALTPGAVNGPTPGIAFIPDQSGVVGDTTTPAIPITLSSSVTVTASSSAPSVVPNNPANLTWGGSGVNRTLTITPIAVGYDVQITVVATGIGTNIFRYSASSGFVSTARFHTASSDASAAISLDSSYMLVGDDETHSVRLYSRTNSGLALKEFNFKAFFNATNLDQDGFPKELDIEAATKVPNRIYWITSHGNSGDGSIVPNRNRLFATALSGSGASSSISFTGYYDKLREDLINWDKTGGHKKGENYYGFVAGTADLHLAKSIDGFNIEGMTMLNGSTNIAYLAFRAPLTPKMTRRNALLIPVLNLPNLVTGNPASGPAAFGDPIELDLGGRGIRSIEGNGTSYVIIAGSPLEATGDPYEFRIFTWSGNALEAPQERSVNLNGLNPEAIVEIPAGTLTSSSQIQILSDNGNAKWYSPADNTSSKDLLVPNWKKFRSDWITIGTVVPPRPYLAKNAQARAGRFTRGSGTDTQYHSYVTAVDLVDGVPFDATGGNADQFYPSHDWTTTLAHRNATNPGSPITFKNPLASFGSQSGATPLYLDRSYTFKVGFGDRPKVAAETSPATINIAVYDRNTMAKSADIQITVPLNPWSANPTVISDGIEVDNDKYGLKTTLRLASVQDGNPPAFYLTHEARKTDYIFLVKGFGFLGPSTNASARPTMVTTNAGSATWSPLYVMNFDSLPPWRSAFIDQPHFDRVPMPPELAGKSVEELMNYSARFTNQPSISVPTNYLALDASAELRRHPVLDQLVLDLGNDPIALANYVQNEIQLTDALSYNDQNAISDQSVNLAGVNRGALATYLEGQGSPQEQCALLMYLLRRAQVPAAYLYPQTNTLKVVDGRLSKLLRMQIKGAVTDTGVSNVPHLVPINYPWITAYIGGQWVHLFPWLKDTEITEGFNLYDFMPAQYNSATKWTRGYLQMHNAIMLLASQTDTITDLFPRYLQSQLRTNYPGISMDDLGVQINDRRHYYARWSDFPQPTVVGSNFTVVESLASITNSFPAMSNLFDLINIEVTSSTTPANKISTGDLLVTDLHNRQFTLWYQTNAGGHAMTLSLASFRPDTITSVAFSAFNPADPRGTNIMNKVASSVTLASNEDEIKIKFTHKRHRALADSFTTNGPSRYSAFLGFDIAQIRSQVEVVSQERTVRKGDLISICINPGRVTPKMMELQNQNYFAMQEIVRTNSAATNSFTLETYQGKLASLLGSTYFQKVDRFRDFAQQLHKAQTISWYSVALSQLGAERNSNGTLVSGAVKVNKPRFDLVHQQLAIAGNGTIHAEAEQDPIYGSMDFYELLMVEASALEHAAINDFYDQSKAVSSVNILQRAQLSGWAREPGILELTATNYLTLGETLYPSGGATKLKAYDPGMWQTITNAFASGSLSNNVRAWITPGPITNEIGKHMGALVFAGRYFAALLSTNLNGAEGAIYTGTVNGLVGGASVTTLYFGNDGQWHERSWFGDLLFGGDKIAVKGPRGEIELNVQLSFADRIALALLGPNATEEEIIQFLIDRGHIFPGQFINYYNLPSNSSSQTMAQTTTGNGNTGDPWWMQAVNFVSDPVDAISGAFYNDEEDLMLAGPFPLAIRRNYSSQNQAHNEFGHGWKISYFPFLVKAVDEQTIYAATPNGSVIAYSFETNNTWRPTVAKNPQVSNDSTPGGTSSDNVFLSRIEKVVSGDTRFIIYDADGTVRTYIQRSFPIAGSTRERPYLDTWRDHRGNSFYFSFGTNSAATDYGQVRRIRSSSGSYVIFSYDTRGHIVEAFASDGRKVQYEYDYSDDLVAVTRPDGSRIEYEYSYVPLPGSTITNNVYGWINSTNNGVPDLYRGIVGTAVITNKVSSHQISRITKPDGRILENDYDKERRVTAQRASAGLDLNPVQNATFSYTNNFVFTNQPSGGITGTTGVKDFFGNTTIYSYNAGLMTQVRDPLGQTTIKSWYGADTNGGYRRSLSQIIDKRGLSTAFKYDSRGNITNATTVGNLTGTGSTNEQRIATFVYDTNSVLQTAISPSAITNRFFYAASNVWLLTRTEVWPSGATSANAITNSVNYTNVSMVFTNGGVVYTNFVNALPQQFLRAAGSSEQASKEMVYNSRGYVVRTIQRTSTSDPDVIADFTTDD